jgi:hypothetical protein
VDIVARDPSGLVEKTSTRLSADYVLATLLTGLLVAGLMLAGHIDPVGDTASRRVVYGLAVGGGLALAWAVYTWINATYSDNSARMVKVRARQGKAIRIVRYHLLAECLILSATSAVAIVTDLDGTWRKYVFYVWIAAVLAAAVGLWRVLRLQWRLNELRELDDQATDRALPVAHAFTWRRSA